MLLIRLTQSQAPPTFF